MVKQLSDLQKARSGGTKGKRWCYLSPGVLMAAMVETVAATEISAAVKANISKSVTHRI